MELAFLDQFADPYLKTETGKGVFLSGIVLGLVAAQQTERGALENAPLCKQIAFGRMQLRDIRRLLARVPELSKAYRLKNAGRVAQLLGAAGDFLFAGKKETWEWTEISLFRLPSPMHGGITGFFFQKTNFHLNF
jgi:hypothetical protein